jgi:hypothetical protein
MSLSISTTRKTRSRARARADWPFRAPARVRCSGTSWRRRFCTFSMSSMTSRSQKGRAPSEAAIPAAGSAALAPAGAAAAGGPSIFKALQILAWSSSGLKGLRM